MSCFPTHSTSEQPGNCWVCLRDSSPETMLEHSGQEQSTEKCVIHEECLQKLEKKNIQEAPLASLFGGTYVQCLCGARVDAPTSSFSTSFLLSAVGGKLLEKINGIAKCGTYLFGATLCLSGYSFSVSVLPITAVNTIMTRIICPLLKNSINSPIPSLSCSPPKPLVTNILAIGGSVVAMGALTAFNAVKFIPLFDTAARLMGASVREYRKLTNAPNDKKTTPYQEMFTRAAIVTSANLAYYLFVFPTIFKAVISFFDKTESLYPQSSPVINDLRRGSLTFICLAPPVLEILSQTSAFFHQKRRQAGHSTNRYRQLFRRPGTQPQQQDRIAPPGEER